MCMGMLGVVLTHVHASHMCIRWSTNIKIITHIMTTGLYFHWVLDRYITYASPPRPLFLYLPTLCLLSAGIAAVGCMQQQYKEKHVLCGLQRAVFL